MTESETTMPILLHMEHDRLPSRDQTEMYGFQRGAIENTIRKQWTTLVGAPEPCSARKAGGDRVARCGPAAESRSIPMLKQRPGAVDRGHEKAPARFPARGTLREFQFPEYTVPVIRASALPNRNSTRFARCRNARGTHVRCPR